MYRSPNIVRIIKSITWKHVPRKEEDKSSKFWKVKFHEIRSLERAMDKWEAKIRMDL